MTPLNVPPPPDNVTVTVNGAPMQLPKGKNLLQALLDVGHYIPHYCYHPRLSVAGNCRLCLIELEGRPKPEIACNMVVADGLKIRTDSELVDSCRKGMMEFLLINHPLDCPICDRGGECMLQRYSVEYGWGTARTIDPRRRFHKPQFDPLIDIERNRCIMCTRCVRFCDEIAGEHVMGVFGHGNRNYIGTYGNGPVSNPFSGNVIDICPVGCLTSKPFRFKARVWELRQTNTTTRTCNGAVTAWTRAGKLYRVTPPTRRRHGAYTIDEDTDEFISNEARFGTHYANHDDRLTTPMIAAGDGAQMTTSWKSALEAAARALRNAGRGEACFLAGERSTNEEFCLLGRLARGLCRAGHIDWRMRFTSEAAARAAGDALRASDGDLDLLARGTYGATLMIHADLLGTAPDIALRIKEAARAGKTRLALLDARVDEFFGRFADPVYLEQPEALATAVNNLAAALEHGRDEAHAPADGAPLFNHLARHEQGLIVLGLDAAGGALNPALVPAALRLVQALGAGWQFLAVTAARNARGAVAAGAQSDRLPTGPVTDPEALRSTSELYGAPLEAPEETPAAPELLRRAAAGQFKVLFLHRCDELVHHPQRELIEQALAATETVIAVDIFPSWITRHADIVLPGSLFYENDGTMTDIDGTLQRMSRGDRPRGDAQEEWRILESIAVLMSAARRHKSAQSIFGDLLKAWNAPTLFRLDDLLLDPPSLLPQTNHVLLSRRTRPNFKLILAERGAQPPAQAAPAAGGGLRLLWNMHSQGPDHLGSRSSEFDALRPQPRLELNPADAAALGLADGDWVRLAGGGARPSQIAISRFVAPGVAAGAANVLGLRLPADEVYLPVIQLERAIGPLPDEALYQEEAVETPA